jgi:RimJ/RimL family protein N-acetyltransferase
MARPVTLVDGPPLVGKLVRLRTRTAADIPLFVRWYGDPDVRHWLHISEAPEPTFETEQARFQQTESDATRFSWIIETGGAKPLGVIALVALDRAHGRAELGISIGEKAYWGRGYGTDAIRVLLAHAFGTLRLRRVTLITDADNERGIRSYEKVGFVKEGVLRAHRLRYGRPIDMLAMAVIVGETK